MTNTPRIIQDSFDYTTKRSPTHEQFIPRRRNLHITSLAAVWRSLHNQPALRPARRIGRSAVADPREVRREVYIIREVVSRMRLTKTSKWEIYRVEGKLSPFAFGVPMAYGAAVSYP